MRRTIDAPDKEWMDLRGLSRWLGVGTKAILAMIESGKICDGVRVGHKTKLWHWRDAVGISIMLSWEGRKVGDESQENPPSKGAP